MATGSTATAGAQGAAAGAGKGIAANLDGARRAIELFHAGRVELMRAMLADDVVWRVPHVNPLAADIVGIDAVLEFFRRVQQETNGTFRAEVLDLAADERTVFCLMRVRAERRGRTLDQQIVNVWRLRPGDGKVYERELFMEDQPASDDFWAY
ncbi:nuclear transport factor 2 family protein [Actinocrinis puniceicyclus]|uniref:Nuclear transport factor 2 family protein n=1 Tax=Actinocrinis puniceicyclus TaxID=977794 RepID=A0A8J7WJB0_9ACTN|nr:nuclear transport factor 2 family protein [Actinocrinis puniceicyclus]MBS2962358.1 nuclear transport factor 2 family protein [Actinocrinis puniceicyclus]